MHLDVEKITSVGLEDLGEFVGVISHMFPFHFSGEENDTVTEYTKFRIRYLGYKSQLETCVICDPGLCLNSL